MFDINIHTYIHLDCFALFTKIKASVRYFFIKVLFFYQMIALQTLWKIFFISSKKLFLFLRYSNFLFYVFFIPFYTIPTQKNKWKWCMMSWIGLQKFVDVIFGITQKPLYIIPSNLVRQYITNKDIFVNFFYHLKNNWPLVLGPYCFWYLCLPKGT